MAARRSVQRSITLAQPRERVWRAVSDPSQLSRWLGLALDVDLRPGGHGWAGSETAGRRMVVEDVRPGTRLAFRWWATSDPDSSASLVEILLEPHPLGTRVVVTETALADLEPQLERRTLAASGALG